MGCRAACCAKKYLRYRGDQHVTSRAQCRSVRCRAVAHFCCHSLCKIWAICLHMIKKQREIISGVIRKSPNSRTDRDVEHPFTSRINLEKATTLHRGDAQWVRTCEHNLQLASQGNIYVTLSLSVSPSLTTHSVHVSTQNKLQQRTNSLTCDLSSKSTHCTFNLS